MNSVDTLFVISAIMVPLLLISLNYESINDFYNIAQPLNDFVLDDWISSNYPDRFQEIKELDDSTCFVTPTNNQYCYKKPKGGEDFKSTHPIGDNGISGELHLEPLHNITGYWTMKDITPINQDSAVITFSDNSERYPNDTLDRWHVTEEFEFTKTVKKYDTFVAICSNNGKNLEVMQFLGIITIEKVDYVATWHIGAASENAVNCKYPQIIQASFGVDFGI